MSRNWTVSRDQYLTKDEVNRLYSRLRDAKDLALQRRCYYCHVRDYFILRLFFETGIRVFELVALRISDYRNGALIVRLGKGAKKRSILLTKQTQQMLGEFLKLKTSTLQEPTGEDDFLFISERNRPYSTRGIRKRVKHWFQLVGLEKSLSCHSARHTFISHLIDKTQDLVLARDQAGHSNLQITSAYTHSLKSNVDDLDLYSADLSRTRNF